MIIIMEVAYTLCKLSRYFDRSNLCK